MKVSSTRVHRHWGLCGMIRSVMWLLRYIYFHDLLLVSVCVSFQQTHGKHIRWHRIQVHFTEITFEKCFGIRRMLFLSHAITPDSKVYRAIMGPTSGRQDPGEPHVGPMNLAI